MIQSLSRSKMSSSNSNRRFLKQNRLSTEQNNIQILYKGLKRKISQCSYSKIQPVYKLKQDHKQNVNQLVLGSMSRQKASLKLTPNLKLQPQQAYEQLLNLKSLNHNLSEQNRELLRQIRKQDKINQIYQKKLQGKSPNQLDYFKAVQIKLLLQVQALQTILQEKQKYHQQFLKYIRSKKHSSKNQIIQKKMQLYKFTITSQKQISKLRKQKQASLIEKQEDLLILSEKIHNIKVKKGQKTTQVTQLKCCIKQQKQKLKQVQSQNKAFGIQNTHVPQPRSPKRPSSFLTSSSKDSQLAKTNLSTITIKNKTNIQQLQKQINTIKQEYQILNGQIQQFMDDRIRRKIQVFRQINQFQERDKMLKDSQDRKALNYSIYQNNVVSTKLKSNRC